MRSKILCLFVCMFFIISANGAVNYSYSRVHFSFILSGHLLFGLGYEYGFDQNHSVQLTLFPLMYPGEGFPFAVTAGYGYRFDAEPWRAKIGLDFAAIISPPDPEKRKIMPILMITPGVEYLQSQNNSFSTQFWLARFLKKANHKLPLMPIGWEFKYGRNL